MSNQQAPKIGEYQPTGRALAILEARGRSMLPPGTKAGSTDVDWEGRKIILPATPVPMSLAKAAIALADLDEQENTLIEVSEFIDALPFDGAQAFQLAINELFGFSLMRPGEVETMFGKQKVKPTLRSVKTGPNPEDYMQVIWGGMAIPALSPDGAQGDGGVVLQCGVAPRDGRLMFHVGGNIPRGKRHIFEDLMYVARQFAVQASIYKGKAFKMKVNDDGSLDLQNEPTFISIDPEIESKLVFSKRTGDQINAYVFSPIKNSAACRAMQVPTKRTVLLSGKYGVGKSMTAAAMAAVSVQNGWTFILIDEVKGLKEALLFAQKYAPAVIFAEDLDRTMSGADRTEAVNALLNTLDGVESKTSQIMTILTTNHVEGLTRALLRPGRLDNIIHVDLPDAEAAEKLARMYGAGFIKPNTALTESRELLANRIPAAIREAVERAKLAAIWRSGGVPSDLVDSDLVVAANSMDDQLKLLETPIEDTRTPEHKLGEALGDIVVTRLGDTKDQVKELHGSLLN